MFGATNQIAGWAVVLVIPIFAWEVSLAIWMITKGFNPSAIAFESPRAEMNATLETSLSRA